LTPDRRFLCRLSLAWGIPQSEIEQTVSARDLDEMREFYQLEPWGSWRDNVHAGIIASVLCNIHRSKDSDPFTYEDFLMMSQEEAQERTERKRRAKAGALFNLLKSKAEKK
jgi:hypothetical protein